MVCLGEHCKDKLSLLKHSGTNHREAWGISVHQREPLSATCGLTWHKQNTKRLSLSEHCQCQALRESGVLGRWREEAACDREESTVTAVIKLHAYISPFPINFKWLDLIISYYTYWGVQEYLLLSIKKQLWEEANKLGTGSERAHCGLRVGNTHRWPKVRKQKSFSLTAYRLFTKFTFEQNSL